MRPDGRTSFRNGSAVLGTPGSHARGPWQPHPVPWQLRPVPVAATPGARGSHARCLGGHARCPWQPRRYAVAASAGAQPARASRAGRSGPSAARGSAAINRRTALFLSRSSDVACRIVSISPAARARAHTLSNAHARTRTHTRTRARTSVGGDGQDAVRLEPQRRVVEPEDPLEQPDQLKTTPATAPRAAARVTASRARCNA